MTINDRIATLPPKRVGLVVPSSNTVMEGDLYERLPTAYRLHSARMYLQNTTLAGETEMLDEHLPQAMRDIRSVKPDVCVFGCTTAGVLRGNACEAELIGRIEAVAQCPVISVASAARNEIRGHKAESVTVVTPYVNDLNVRIQESLENDGITVDGIYGFGITDNFAIAAVAPSQLIEQATKWAKRHKADALFISCTNLRALEAASSLEPVLEVPVITSNGAALRATLTALEEPTEEELSEALRPSINRKR